MHKKAAGPYAVAAPRCRRSADVVIPASLEPMAICAELKSVTTALCARDTNHHDVLLFPLIGSQNEVTMFCATTDDLLWQVAQVPSAQENDTGIPASSMTLNIDQPPGIVKITS